jgi:alcohol dehydrogenase
MKESEYLALRKFVVPEIVFGVGARDLVGRYAKNLGVGKVLVVTDPGVMAAGWTAGVTDRLEAEGIAFVVFSDVSPNPRSEQVMAGAEVYRAEGCTALVAVGGGSPMDTAKGIGIVISNNAPILGFAGVDEVPVPGPPLLCVPTTAGSSADVSQFAIITDLHHQRKVAIISKSVVPDVALVDPATTTTMDARLTAATGLDALTHGIEAYVSNAHSPITDLHALEAIRLTAGNIVGATRGLDDIEARAGMMLGSLHAGMAFSNASLGAVHAMAHGLSGLLDLAHGEANALLLAAVIEYNFEAAPVRYRRISEAMGGSGSGLDELIDAIGRLRRDTGITWTLRDLGVERRHLPTLADHAMHDPCMVTNPRQPTQDEIEAVYAAAL